MKKQESKFLTFSWFLFLSIGILLLSDGYTGRYLTDFPNKEVCLNDFDCNAPDVCCKFYQEDSGVCDLPQNCIAIKESTQDKVVGSKDLANAPSVTNQLGLNTLYLYGGTILILLAIIGFIYTSKQQKK